MDIQELHSFKLSDAVKFHDQLNPKLFKKDKLDPKVRKQLLLIAQDFMEELGISGLNVKDITLSGSNAAYTYTKHSDCDLHILIDMAKLPQDEVYRELFNAKKTLYNDSHDIKVHGVPVELYVQDTAEPVKSLGEYSILNDEWINFPKKRKASLDITNTKLKFSKLLDVVKLALKSGDIEKINNLLQLLKRYRQAGLDKGGEFSPENLAFKSLRSQGLIKKLYDIRGKLHSKELSIENVNEEKMKFLRPGELRGSWSDSELRALGFRQAQNGAWYIPKSKWEELVRTNKIYEEGTLAERLAIELEDYDPNGPPPGPEFKPTMPQGTVRVDVSDVYDWYKLGQHISNLKGLGNSYFGKGPPSTIMAFGSEDEEHNYIKNLEKTGLTTTDIDPIDPKQPKGMKRQKVDPTYNVNEDESTNKLAWRIDFGDKFKELSSLIPERSGRIYLMPVDEFGLETFSNLTGEEPDQIENISSQVYKVSGEALVGDMSIVNEIVNAMHYMQINKSNLPLKRQYESHIAKLKKRYLNTRVPYSQYKSGQFDMPEILAKPNEIQKLDKSVIYNNKTGKIEIKNLTHDINESQQLFEINFNNPEIIKTILAGNIRCGFEAESIWPIKPSYTDPFENINDYADLESRMSRHYRNTADSLYQDWIFNHPDFSQLQDRKQREWVREYLDDEDMMIRFYDEYSDGDPDITDEQKVEFVENNIREYKSWLYEKSEDESDQFSDDALQEMYANYDMDNFIDDVYGSIAEFASDGLNLDSSDLGIEPSLDVDIQNVADTVLPWIEISSQFKDLTYGLYHQTQGDDLWRIETDSSITPNDDDEQVGAEIISPVYETPGDMLNEMFSLFKYFNTNDVETNESCGLHVTMSMPTATNQLNKLKVGLLLGDPYVLKLFGRGEGTQGYEYTKSEFLRLKSIAQNVTDPNNLRELEAILNRNLAATKYVTAHFKTSGRVEFRAAGGSDYQNKTEEIRKTVSRYALVMLAGHDTKFMQQEYYKMLGRLVRETFLSGSGDVLKNSFVNVFNRLTSYIIDQIAPDLSNFSGDVKALRTMIDSTGASQLEIAKARQVFIELLEKLVSQPNLKPVTDMESRIIRTTAKRLGLNSVEQIVDELNIVNWMGNDLYKVRAFAKLDDLLKTKIKRPDNLQTVTESIKTITKLGPQLFVPKRDLAESIKPNAELWTSSSKKTPNGYTSAWVEWCKDNEPSWIRPEGILFDVAPGARILVVNTDKDVIEVAKKYGIEAKDSIELFRKMRWDVLANDYDAIHHKPVNRYDNMFMSTWDVESTAWLNKKFLINPRKVKIDQEVELSESASGYIPSNAEKNDPRFKTGLTVDIKPDTMQKNAKKLGWKISRAGIPPLLRK